MASPISWTMASSRCWITDTVMRSGVMALIYIEKTLAVYCRRSVPRPRAPRAPLKPAKGGRTHVADPPDIPQDRRRGRRRCGDPRVPHGDARPAEEAHGVVEPRLLQGRGRGDAE